MRRVSLMSRFVFNLPDVAMMTIIPMIFVLMLLTTHQVEAAKERRSVLFNGWRSLTPANQYFFPRTENYYHKLKPEAVVEILLDTSNDDGGDTDDTDDGILTDDVPFDSMVEHSSITTSIKSQAEYKASCVKEPGCRWECEPRQDELPPDCDCNCSYFQAYWDNIP